MFDTGSRNKATFEEELDILMARLNSFHNHLSKTNTAIQPLWSSHEMKNNAIEPENIVIESALILTRFPSM